MKCLCRQNDFRQNVFLPNVFRQNVFWQNVFRQNVFRPNVFRAKDGESKAVWFLQWLVHSFWSLDWFITICSNYFLQTKSNPGRGSYIANWLIRTNGAFRDWTGCWWKLKGCPGLWGFLAPTHLAEWQLAEWQSAEWQSAEWQLAEQQLAESQLAEQQLAERQLVEWQLAERQLAEWQSANNN